MPAMVVKRPLTLPRPARAAGLGRDVARQADAHGEESHADRIGRGGLGAGTMGSGIAALCAEVGCRVQLLDVSRAAAEQAIARMVEGRPPLLDDPARAELITPGSFDDDLPAAVGAADWVCEAIVEDLATKRALFGRIEPLRREGSVVSSNISGILLRTITEGLPERLRRDIAVTHFFNPVRVMKLVELVPGADTRAEVIRTFEHWRCRPRVRAPAADRARDGPARPARSQDRRRLLPPAPP
jgi:3-hydroxyacyl-CoA dehydrogenase